MLATRNVWCFYVDGIINASSIIPILKGKKVRFRYIISPRLYNREDLRFELDLSDSTVYDILRLIGSKSQKCNSPILLPFAKAVFFPQQLHFKLQNSGGGGHCAVHSDIYLYTLIKAREGNKKL